MENRAVGISRCGGGGGGGGGRLMRLPPGFRFHPTDEELLEQYLRKKVQRCPIPAFLIPEVELSRYDPWDLPSCGGVNSSKKEWYVFCLKGGAYRNTGRLTRAAGTGFWKAAGKERQVVSSKGSGRVIGTRKALVFYRGRHPDAQRTDWTMHEYRLTPSGNTAAQCSSADQAPGMQTGEWVLCHIFDKRAPQEMGLEAADLLELRHARNQFARFLAHHNDAHPASHPPDDMAESSCVTELSGGSSEEEDNSVSSS